MLQKIIFQLDTLLDTRLGFLAGKYPDYVDSIISDTNGKFVKYIERFTDEHPTIGMDTAEFRKQYRERDSSVLPLSMLTALTIELRKIIRQIFTTATTEPSRVSGIQLDINIYPYTDLTDEVKLAILETIRRYAAYPIEINIVCLSIGTLSPQYLTDNDYVGIYLYDFEEWLGLHYGPLIVEHPAQYMPTFTVNCPAALTNVDILKEVAAIEAPNGETIDPIIGLRSAFAQLFKLEIDDVGLYSIAHPEYLKQNIPEMA